MPFADIFRIGRISPLLQNLGHAQPFGRTHGKLLLNIPLRRLFEALTLVRDCFHAGHDGQKTLSLQLPKHPIRAVMNFQPVECTAQ